MMWDWHGYGWWWWSAMWAGMVLLWAALAWAVVALVRANRGASPEALLTDRFARGEIDADEYHDRLDVLRGHRRARGAT
jgi:putative membrane protein